MKATLTITDLGGSNVDVRLDFDPELKVDDVERAVNESLAVRLAFDTLGWILEQRDDGTEPIVKSITKEGASS